MPKSNSKTVNVILTALIIVLVCSNIFFGIRYFQNSNRKTANSEIANISPELIRTEEQLKTAEFMKFFVKKVIASDDEITFEDRIKFESDIRKIGDEELVNQWEVFVSSEEQRPAQEAAVKLMKMLAEKLI
jgi:hypothetical protein